VAVVVVVVANFLQGYPTTTIQEVPQLHTVNTDKEKGPEMVLEQVAVVAGNWVV
jgi:hypothetical protein